MRALTVGGIVVFALVAAFLLTHTVGQRRPGQTITGNAQVAAAGRPRRADPGPALAAAAKRAARRATPRASRTRATCSQTSDYTDAIHEFGAAARLDPSQPEPPTYAGWAGALARAAGRRTRRRASRCSTASLERIDEVDHGPPEVPRRVRAARASSCSQFEGDAQRRHPVVPAVPRAAPTTPTRCARRCSPCSRRREKAGDAGSTTPTQPEGDPSWPKQPEPQTDADKIYRATITTDRGTIVMDLDPQLAPNTVNNFVGLARDGYYDGLTFHRVVPEFVIQGGCPEGSGRGGPGYKFADEPVKGEYTLGAVAMANSGPDTNGSQFFICIDDCQTQARAELQPLRLRGRGHGRRARRRRSAT